MKISIEQLKKLRALCNDSTVWASVLDELISIRELKGDQVPVGWRFEDCENEPCTNGAVVSVGTGSDNIHLCAECSRNDKYKRQRTVALSQRLSLKVTAPQKLSNLPYDVLFNAIGKAVNIQGEALSISVKAFKEAIEAAGSIVKDGE